MPGKVLIITYYWPPSGGAGVQRWLKFTKYLPSAGWIPVVLTVRPEAATYPFTDPSLYGDVPLDVEVTRTNATNYFRLYSRDKTKIPSSGFANNPEKGFKDKLSRFLRGNLFIPDPRRGWNRYAVKEASRIITAENINTVVTSSPPHSTQLIGLRLKKKFPHLKWIADLRDPWTDIYYYESFYPTALARLIDNHYERAVLRKADLITTVGFTLGQQFAAKIAGIEDKIHIIPNGYDESDFWDVKPEPSPCFTITFTGTLSDLYPVGGFVNAVKALQNKGCHVKVRFTGMISDNQRQDLITQLGSDNLEFIKYVDHGRAIGQMVSASLLLLVIAKHRDNKSFLSGKLFEYIASGTPVLCLGPVDGDAARLIEQHRYGRCFDYNDSSGIENFIMEHIANPQQKRSVHPYEFSRKHLTEQYARLL